MAKRKYTYTAQLPDGGVVTRGSNREYEFYWSCTDGDKRGESGFAKDEKGAQSSITSARNRLCKPTPIPTTEYKVRVTRVEH